MYRYMRILSNLLKTVLKSSLSHMGKSDFAFLLLPSIHLIPGGFKMLEYKEEGVWGAGGLSIF